MKTTINPSQVDAESQRTSDTTWIITLEEDAETGDVVMPLPDDLMAAQGWSIGDTLTWDIDEDGTITLKRDTGA